MRIVAAVAIICFTLFSAFHPAYLPETKKVGVYDRDSVLAEMPEYQRVLTNVSEYKGMLDKQLLTMRLELTRKSRELEQDSTNWSPMIRELKLQEYAELEGNIDAFIKAADADLEGYREQLITPVYDKIKATANNLAKKKRFDKVVDKQELNGYRVMNPDAMTMNVTAQMIKEVKK